MDFFNKESKSRRGGGVKWGGGRGKWMDRRTGPKQFAPSTSLKLGHNNALMYKSCP